MNNADAYSLCHAKLDNPDRNCIAACKDVARKKAKLKQKMLNVKIRCPHNEKKAKTGRG
jgi:hypothetical protein